MEKLQHKNTEKLSKNQNKNIKVKENQRDPPNLLDIIKEKEKGEKEKDKKEDINDFIFFLTLNLIIY